MIHEDHMYIVVLGKYYFVVNGFFLLWLHPFFGFGFFLTWVMLAINIICHVHVI
jgi:hypothetical protein